MAAKVNMTQEELENNYEFKVIKKAIKQEFPFIVDLVNDPSELNSYNIIFLDAIVDPVKASEYFNSPLNKSTYFWHKYKMGKRSNIYISSVLNMSVEEGAEFQKEIDNFVDRLHASKHIPEEYKLPNRYLRVNQYIVPEEPLTPYPDVESSD